MHHPLVVPERLPDCGIDILMAGHLHESRVNGAAAIVVQAGTATSSRTREEPNSFNVLRISRERVQVRHYALREGSFVPAADEAFQRAPAGWTRCAL
jgi:predicted phosphodiesterase